MVIRTIFRQSHMNIAGSTFCTIYIFFTMIFKVLFWAGDGDYYNGVTTGLCCRQSIPARCDPSGQIDRKPLVVPWRSCSCKFLLNQSIDLGKSYLLIFHYHQNEAVWIIPFSSTNHYRRLRSQRGRSLPPLPPLPLAQASPWRQHQHLRSWWCRCSWEATDDGLNMW